MEFVGLNSNQISAWKIHSILQPEIKACVSPEHYYSSGRLTISSCSHRGQIGYDIVRVISCCSVRDIPRYTFQCIITLSLCVFVTFVCVYYV